MSRLPLAFALLALASATCRADNCEALKSQIDTRIRAGGLADFRLDVVDAAASAAGRSVGSCSQGSRKIVMLREAVPGADAGASAVAAAAPRKSRKVVVLTECRDGSSGPDCTKPQR